MTVHPKEAIPPCPFCGGPVEFRKSHVLGEGGHIQHTELGYSCPITLDSLAPEYDDFIVAAWNRRAK